MTAEFRSSARLTLAEAGADAPGPETADPPPPDGEIDWNNEVLFAMEQGILVWSREAVCVMFNPRIFDVLELDPDDLALGMRRADFLAAAVRRGEITEEVAREAEEKFRRNRPFAFDRKLPSGRMVVCNVRPVRGGGRVVTFTDVTEARRGEEELARAKRKADEAHRAVHLALVEQRARQKEARMLAELDEWLQSCKSLDELFLILRTFMERTLPGTQGELYVYSNSRDVLDGACAWGHDALHDHIAPDSCWALRRGRSYSHTPEKICFTCDHVEAQHHEPPSEDYLCVPIVAHGDTVGLLHIRFDAMAAERQIETPHAFALQCAEHVSLAIANVKLRDELRDQSTRDPLTGLYNRRYFLEALRGAITTAARKEHDAALIAFDADKFKHFNDNHGHDAGDMVLRAIGQTLTMLFEDGVACRFGGEEFALLLPDTGAEVAGEAAERLRRAIEGMELRYGGGTLPGVTVSAGVAVFPACGQLPQDLIRAADKALYAAKDAGRNCWRFADCVGTGASAG